MPRRLVTLIDGQNSEWEELIREFFEDTPTEMERHDAKSFQASTANKKPDIIFAAPEQLSLALAQKLKVYRRSYPESRLFKIGEELKNSPDLPFDGALKLSDAFSVLQTQLVKALPYPETVSVLIVDDEPGIAGMIKEYLDGRSQPAFHVRYAENGKKGLEAILQSRPDVLLLDIKMPVMTGHELYREIKNRALDLPVIIFFDAVSGHEIVEIHKIGRPAILEKGSQQSSMPELMTQIKKMAYFG